eukprot:TRINITY_DN9403_c0_g1_i1.p1 TRINITY_DN9403_c0_g1~~TRINITY_DN9403_c0_g1_i1.p1  ORF type:complete len:327 (+),score=25.90 TRINITY_DN9403_c0_g1_i1:100-1080(+)
MAKRNKFGQRWLRIKRRLKRNRVRIFVVTVLAFFLWYYCRMIVVVPYRHIGWLFRFEPCLPVAGEIPEGLKIGIGSFACYREGQNATTWVQHSMENKRRYAEKHGYTFMDWSQACGTEQRKLEEITAITRKRHPEKKMKGRRSNWMKVDLVERNLNRFDWLMYLDIDTWIMNDNIKLEQLLRGSSNDNMVLSRDGCGVNTGVWLMRNCAASRKLLKKWKKWRTNPIYYKDQRAFTQTYNMMAGDWGGKLNMSDDSNVGRISPKKVAGIKILRACSMNCVPGVKWTEEGYVFGDFLIHLFGLRVPQKSAVMEDLYKGDKWLTSAPFW